MKCVPYIKLKSINDIFIRYRSLYLTNHDIEITRKMEINHFYEVRVYIYSIKMRGYFFQVAANIFSYFKTKVHLHIEVAFHLTSSVSMLVIAVILRFYQDQIFHIKKS